MPFKSQAQRRKFAELLVKGEISPDTFEEWNRETGSRKLPERVKPKGATGRNARPPANARSNENARSNASARSNADRPLLASGGDA